MSSCGTTPSLSTGANDIHGTVTEGTTATGCTVTFQNAYANAPDCVVSFRTQLPAAMTYSTASGAAGAATLTVTNTSASNDKFTYQCMGL